MQKATDQTDIPESISHGMVPNINSLLYHKVSTLCFLFICKISLDIFFWSVKEAYICAYGKFTICKDWLTLIWKVTEII